MPHVEDRRHQVVPIAVPTTVASGLVYGRACYLHGLTLRETTGAAVADVDLTNGADAGAAPAATVTLKAGESVREFPSAHGIWCPSGLFLRVNAGSVRGAVFIEEAS